MRSKRFQRLRISVFCLTFLSYLSYHCARKAFSVIKSSLHPDVPGGHAWEPFDGDGGKVLLGLMDSIFLGAYTIGLFFVGYVGEHCDLRKILALGSIGTGILTFALGVAFYMEIHSLSYFLILSAAIGLFQATGWPTAVAIMGNWFAQEDRGLIMGLWSWHAALGNIVGNILSSIGLEFPSKLPHESNWGMALILPAVMILFVGVILGVCLIPHPRDAHLEEPQPLDKSNANEVVLDPSYPFSSVPSPKPKPLPSSLPSSSPLSSSSSPSTSTTTPDILPMSIAQPQRRPGEETSGEDEDDETDTFIKSPKKESVPPPVPPRKKLGLIDAFWIPGVWQFCLSLFFTKLVVYAVLFWLPFYLTRVNYSSSEAARIASFFDIGGMLGGVIAGYLSDRWKKPAFISVLFLLFSMPSLWAYRYITVASHNVFENVGLMTLLGILISGPFSLITTAVSVDLGTCSSLEGNHTAIALVSGIIDGSGSLGACAQGIIIGVMSTNLGWDAVFYLLVACCVLSAFPLINLARREFSRGLITLK